MRGFLRPDLGQLGVDLLTLLVAVTALSIALPDPAKLWVDASPRFPDNGLSFATRAEADGQRPYYIFLDLYFVVANIGGRQGVLSHVQLAEFLDADGKSVDILFPVVRARTYSTLEQWVDTTPVREGQRFNSEKFTIRTEIPPPMNLRPDDVVTLRLRHRLQLDWSKQWDLTRLQKLGEDVAQPITHIRATVTYWQSNLLVVDRVRLPLPVNGQDEYRAALERVTAKFSVRPDFPEDRFYDPEQFSGG